MISFPKYLTIDTHNYCNASCGYCPYVQLSKSKEQGFMDHDLFLRIVEECVRHRDQIEEVRFGNIAESLMGGEKSWWYIERWVEQKLCLLFASNMTYFDEAAQERLDKLGWDGNVIAHVEQGMGIDFDRTLKNCDAAMARWGPSRVRRTQPQTTGLRRWARDPEIQNHKATYCSVDRPYTTMIIGWDGLVSLCCVDTKREVIVGDLNKTSIEEAWTGEGFTEARNKLHAGIQDICNHCDWGEA